MGIYEACLYAPAPAFGSLRRRLGASLKWRLELGLELRLRFRLRLGQNSLTGAFLRNGCVRWCLPERGGAARCQQYAAPDGRPDLASAGGQRALAPSDCSVRASGGGGQGHGVVSRADRGVFGGPFYDPDAGKSSASVQVAARPARGPAVKLSGNRLIRMHNVLVQPLVAILHGVRAMQVGTQRSVVLEHPCPALYAKLIQRGRE